MCQSVIENRRLGGGCSWEAYDQENASNERARRDWAESHVYQAPDPRLLWVIFTEQPWTML